MRSPLKEFVNAAPTAVPVKHQITLFLKIICQAQLKELSRKQYALVVLEEKCPL
jgi:hypothetical protein